MIYNLKSTSKKILLIEDDKFLSKAYVFFLQKSGYITHNAKDVLEARKMIKKNKPNLIMLDLMMPGINGLVYLKELKGNEYSKDIPVIIVSNLSQKKDIKNCMDLGAADYLIKSNFSMLQIVKKIEKRLSK